MIQKLYHKIGNKILLYKYDKKFWKLPFYHFFVVTDYILYLMSPLQINLSRKKYCGENYMISNFGVFITDFDNLQDYISRTQKGIERKCPFVLVPVKNEYEYPMHKTSITYDKISHVTYRQSQNYINLKLDKEKLKDDVMVFIEECITNKTFCLIKPYIPLYKLIYKQFDINISDDSIQALNRPFAFIFTSILCNFIPQKYLIPEERTKATDELMDILSKKYPNTSSENILVQICAIQNATENIRLLLYKIMKEITNNNLIDIIREDLQNGKEDLLIRCIFESMRFFTFHAGSTLVETLESCEQIEIDNTLITLKKDDSIIRNIPACLSDTKYFPEKFYPYHSNIDLIKKTTFNGLLSIEDKLDMNLHNRSCQMQEILPELLKEFIKRLILTYTWESMDIKFFETPFDTVTLNNIKKNN